MWDKRPTNYRQLSQHAVLYCTVIQHNFDKIKIDEHSKTDLNIHICKIKDLLIIGNSLNIRYFTVIHQRMSFHTKENSTALNCHTVLYCNLMMNILSQKQKHQRTFECHTVLYCNLIMNIFSQGKRRINSTWMPPQELPSASPTKGVTAPKNRLSSTCRSWRAVSCMLARGQPVWSSVTFIIAV